MRWGLDSGPGLTLVLDGVVGQSEGMQHTAPVLPKHPGQLLDKVPSGKGRKDVFVPGSGLPLLLHLSAWLGLRWSEVPTGGEQLGACREPAVAQEYLGVALRQSPAVGPRDRSRVLCSVADGRRGWGLETWGRLWSWGSGGLGGTCCVPSLGFSLLFFKVRSWMRWFYITRTTSCSEVLGP